MSGGLKRPGRRWRNWGRTVDAHPAYRARPADVDEAVALVRAAAECGLRVKAVGSGHSFTAAAATAGVLVEPDRMRGLVGVDVARGRARVRAGTYLWELPGLLAPYGLAVTNLGDVDRQTLAGATSTATHGTGTTFGSLASQLTGVTLVTGTGEVLRVDDEHHPELLPAVRVGLGALGVLVELELQCVPAFLLRSVERPKPMAEVLAHWETTANATDHVEFYWWPHTTTMMAKANTRLPLDTAYERPNPVADWFEQRVLENEVLRAKVVLGRALPWVTPPLNRLATRVYGDRQLTGPSHEVFTSPRLVRFRECEYALPFDAVPDALRALRDLVERRGWPLSFPVEVRSSAAEETWLAPGFRRRTGWIAVHRYAREAPGELFRSVDALFADFDGRPHWGKLHFADADALRPRYPRFGDFLALRDRLDPDRRFANAYLTRVLGP